MTRTQRTDAPQRTPHSRTTSGLKPGGIGLAVPHLRIDLEQGVFPRAAPARTTRLAAAICAAFGVALSAPAARGQQMVTPAIADSPTAQTLMGDLQAQARENPAESARIARRLLDEYGDRVVRVGVETDELFRSVAAETERFLLATPAVLARFRDLESRAADRMLRDEGPAATAARRRLTAAGLRASLLLAEGAIRADRPREALGILARIVDHPDMAGEEALSRAVLEAMAHRRMGDVSRASLAIATLGAIAGVDAARRDAAAAGVGRVQAKSDEPLGRTPLASSRVGGDPDETWREIWSLDLDQSLFRRLFSVGFSSRVQRDLEQSRAAANLMVALPTVLDGRVFISEGHRVRAIDVDSRDELWSRPIGSSGGGRESSSVSDLSAIAANARSLVVYEGHAIANERSGAARVWCLDPFSGAVRWDVALDAIEGRPDLEGLYPTGAPQLVSDVVVVAARKPTQRLEQVDWMLGLDEQSGALRWAISMAGAPANRSIAGRKIAGTTSNGEVVVHATPLGVVASVRASDGAVEWLRRFPVPLRDPRFYAEPWEAGSPAICGDRVVAIAPDELEVLALDLRSGTLLETRPIGPDTPWAGPSYLLSAELPEERSAARPSASDPSPNPASDAVQLVLAVGSDICAFDARDLSKRLWSYSESTRAITPPIEGVANRFGIRGRVSVAGPYVVVPTVREILLLDLASGVVRTRVPSEQPSNPLLLGDRLVAAGDESLRVLMPSERAESMLRARLAAAPDDPSAAIALLELAQATQRPAVALDAARTAERALQRVPGTEAMRAELIDKLVALAIAYPEQGDEAFAIAARVCNTPTLVVRAEMARGEFLRTSGRSREASAAWTVLAADPVVASQLVGDTGVGRQVRMEALARVASLTARDREIAESIDSAAARAAAALGPNPDVATVARFLQDHPRTAAVPDVLTAASDLPFAAFEGLAVVAIRDLLLPPAQTERIDAIRNALASRARSAQERSALAAIDSRIADLSHASGIDRADIRPPSPPLPAVGATPVLGLDLRPRLLAESSTARATRDRMLVLGLLDGALVRMDGPDLSLRWRLRLDDRDPLLLWAKDRVVLWQTLPKGEFSALIIDPSDGTLLYASPRASELWPEVAAGPERAQPEQGSPFGNAFQPDPNARRFAGMPAQVSAVCDGASLVLARRNGDIARIGFMDERPTPVLIRGALEQLTTESIEDGLLTVGGRVSAEQGFKSVVRVFDATTMSPLARIEPISQSDVKWAFATRLGEVFIGTRTAIERWTFSPGGDALPTLVSFVTETLDTERPTLLGANLLAFDASTRPVLVPILAGDPRNFSYPDGADARQVRDFQVTPQGVLIQSDDRFVLVGPSGECVGLDSSNREATLSFGLAVQGEILQVNTNPPDADPGRVRYQLSCVIERLDPARGLRNLGGAFEVRARDSRISRVLAVDGWLLLSNAQGTIAVSLPPTRDLPSTTGDPPGRPNGGSR